MPDVALIRSPVAPSEADELVEMSRRFPAYRPSSYRAPRPHKAPPRASAAAEFRGSRQATAGPARAVPEPLAARPGLPLGRLDAARNFRRTGGRKGRTEDGSALLAARTNYFRATYAQSNGTGALEARKLLRHERLIDAARALYDRPVVVPFVVYANLLIPGQELGVHTDVPVFRGVDRSRLPPWLLVVMRHSGLFEDRRLLVATIILYFGNSGGGEFAYFPAGAGGACETIPAQYNSAVALDADSIFHGVDRVDGDDAAVAELRTDMRLTHRDQVAWNLLDGERVVARFASDDVRFSVSWKAYCLAEGQSSVRAPDGELPVDAVLHELTRELLARGRLSHSDHGLSKLELANLLIDEFVSFPAA